MKDGAWAINSPENVEGLTFLKGLYEKGLTRTRNRRSRRATKNNEFLGTAS